MNISTLSGRMSALLAAVVIGAALSGPAAAQEDAPATDAAIEVVRSGIPHDALYALEMSGQWGMAIGNYGLMLETADGGQSWQTVEPKTPLALLGITRAGDRVLIVGQQGLAMLREGSGEWQTVDTGFTQRLLNVDMNDAGLVITVGEFGFIGRSRDGGKTWEPLPIDWTAYNDEGYEPHLYGAVVRPDGSVFVAGEFGLILRSTDGGDNFEAVHRGDESVFDLFLPHDGGNVGFAVGQEGLVLRTMDGGATWEKRDAGSEANLLGVWAGNDEVVIAGIRQMLRSSDNGATFTAPQDLNVIRTWYQGVAAGEAASKTGARGVLHEQNVYIVGHRGSIARVLK